MSIVGCAALAIDIGAQRSPRHAHVRDVPHDLLDLLFRRPGEGVQTCLVVTLGLAFALGIASVGALYRFVLLRSLNERAHPLAARGAERGDELALGADASPAAAVSFVLLLLRSAFWGRRHG